VILVGTSGWQYDSWRGPLYPPTLPKRAWLEYYAGTFATLEVNNAFYRLPERATFEDWAARVPPGFVVAVKMSRYLTHIRRLREPAEPVARFLGRAAGLGAALGPVLVQLPPTLGVDVAALDEVLTAFAGRVRVAVELRHESWWVPAVRDMLAAHDAALCWADRSAKPVGPLWRTATFGYLRMHEGRATPIPRYGSRALDSWLDRITDAFPDEADVFTYFNNDTDAAAIHDARSFAQRAARRGALAP
jgi:uncharacterized protein YecE (DUF72 family)